MATIELHAVRKSFQTLEVIHGIDLAVADGSFTVLVGPSGCGKSTLLRMIAGLEEVTSGEILIDGARCDHLMPGARGMAMVFQSYALYPHMSVVQNLRFGLENQRLTRPRSPPASPPPPRSSSSARSSPAGRTSSPAARASASPSAGPSSRSPRPSSSTSRSPTSTPNSGSACAASSPRCTSGWDRR